MTISQFSHDVLSCLKSLQIDESLSTEREVVCAHCGGIGRVRDDRVLRTGQPAPVVDCPDCHGGTQAALDRCWIVGELRRDDPGAPTFANYRPLKIDGGASQAMLDAAQRFAATPVGWLVFHGNGCGRAREEERRGGKARGRKRDLRPGSGKSHLAEAIARALLDREVPTLFMTAPALTVYLGATKRGDEEIDYEARLRWMSLLPVLIIDDLGTESASEFVDRTLYRLLNERWLAATRGRGGATVITSNDHPDHWPDRLGSRAMDARFVQVLAGPIDVRRVERD